MTILIALERLRLHEVNPSIAILVWFYCWNLQSISMENARFVIIFYFLYIVPVLQVINYANMVYQFIIIWNEFIPALKTRLKLKALVPLCFFFLKFIWFFFNDKKKWVVHEAHFLEKFAILLKNLVYMIWLLNWNVDQRAIMILVNKFLNLQIIYILENWTTLVFFEPNFILFISDIDIEFQFIFLIFRFVLLLIFWCETIEHFSFIYIWLYKSIFGIIVNSSFGGISFDIKDKSFHVLLLTQTRVLLNYEIQRRKLWCLNCENSIYLCKERLIIGTFFEMVNILIQHLKQDFLLITSKSFDYELIVIRKKEEWATLSCSLSCFENHSTIHVNIKRFEQPFITNIVKIQNLIEFFHFSPYYLTL